MIIREASLTAYQEGQPLKRVRFTVNAYHVTIQPDGGSASFVRTPDKEDWLDEKHQAITNALAALEIAINKAVAV